MVFSDGSLSFNICVKHDDRFISDVNSAIFHRYRRAIHFSNTFDVLLSVDLW